MTDRIMITGISGVRPHRHNDVCAVDCSSDQRSTHLALHRGVLGTLIVSLLQAARAFPSDTDEFLSQPLQLTGVGVVSFEDGSFGLELLLDEGLRLFVAIRTESIAALHDCVNDVGTLDSAMTGHAASMTQH